MARRTLALATLLVAAAPLPAVITRLTPLSEVLANEQWIFTAAVESLDRDRPAAVLVVRSDLKGKAPYRRLPVMLTGDRTAQAEKQTPRLLDRLAPGLDLVIFASLRGPRRTLFAYTNGTWFQLTGAAEAWPEDVRLEFAHLEPYLRRTFKGTTAELRQAVADGLAGTKAPPPPDANEPPGIGPPVPK